MDGRLGAAVLTGNEYRFGKNWGCSITVAQTLPEKKRAWRMVYQSYLEKGYAKIDSDELWYGLYDMLPQTTTFIASRDGIDVATLTVVFDSEFGVPADQLYHDELDRMRQDGRRICEIVSLASNESDRRQGIEVLKHLFNVGFHMASKLVDATDFIITVNPHHASYYERKLLFRRHGEERSYAKVGGAPAVLLVLDLTTANERYLDEYGPDNGSLWHHFFSERTASSTVWFLVENVNRGGRQELMGWFRRKKPAVLERLGNHISPFDAAREAQLRQSAACAPLGLARDPSAGEVRDGILMA
ncbi:MAG: hypothetical protein C0404_14590 [Verrucomicrobia bacterium]|nr:hypothetical protein [Verrucomicrobiota bacterium]